MLHQALCLGVAQQGCKGQTCERGETHAGRHWCEVFCWKIMPMKAMRGWVQFYCQLRLSSCGLQGPSRCMHLLPTLL